MGNLCMFQYGTHDDVVNNPNLIMVAIQDSLPAILVDNTYHSYWGQAGVPGGSNRCVPADYPHSAVYGYLTSSYETYNATTLAASITAIATDGAAGIFLDEITDFPNSTQKTYLSTVYTQVHGLGLKLIVNPGVSTFDYAFFAAHSDYILTDEGYAGTSGSTQHPTGAPTASDTGYGLSKVIVASDVCMTSGEAITYTKAAWAFGFGYAWMTDSTLYILPSYLDDYIDGLKGNANNIHASSVANFYSPSWLYSTAHDATSISPSSIFFVGQNYGLGFYSVYRTCLIFDTSIIPASATISAVNLRVYADSSGAAQGTSTMCVLSGMPAFPNNPVIASDYNKALYSTTVLGSLASSAITGAGYYPISLSPGLINTTGDTKFCLRSQNDIDNTTPSGPEYLEFNGNTNLPYLEITYVMPDGIYFEVALNQSIFVDPATATWTELSSDGLHPDGRGLKVKRGRMHGLNRIEAGTAEMEINNQSGNYWRYNSASPLYPYFKPLTPVRIRNVKYGINYPIFYGVIESNIHDWVEKEHSAGKTPITTIHAVDLFKTLTRQTIPAGTPSWPAELSSDRVTRVLNFIATSVGLASWPANLQNIDTGKIKVAALTITSVNGLDILTHLQAVADAESGTFFIAADGKVTFQNHDSRWVTTPTSGQSAFGASFASFTTGSDGNIYAKPEMSDDDTFIYNTAVVNYNGTANAATWQDASFIDQQGVRVWQNTDGVIYLVNDAQNQAIIQAERYVDSILRATSLVIEAEASPDELYPKVLGYDISTRITLNLDNADNPSAIPAIQYHIEGIEHEWSAVDTLWITTWQLWDVNQYRIVDVQHDGNLFQSGAIYATVHDAPTTSFVQNDGSWSNNPLFSGDSHTMFVGQAVTGIGADPLWIGRGFLQFDTSALGSNTIKSAWIAVEVKQSPTVDFAIDIVSASTVTNPVTGTDYHVLLGSIINLGTVMIDHTMTAPYNIIIPITNPDSNINKTGSTRFGLRSEHDRANAGAPGVGVVEAAIITTLNSSTSNFKTKLIIQYNTAGP